jgi:hypothetical protein
MCGLLNTTYFHNWNNLAYLIIIYWVEDLQSTLQKPDNLTPKEFAVQTLKMTLVPDFAKNNPDFVDQFADKMIEHPIPPHGINDKLRPLLFLIHMSVCLELVHRH